MFYAKFDIEGVKKILEHSKKNPVSTPTFSQLYDGRYRKDGQDVPVELSTKVTVDDVYQHWRRARAFLVDNHVCGEFSVPSAEDLEDAIAADEEGRCPDWDPCVSFFIYGERGLKREYFVGREMIENGEKYEGGLCVVYCDGEPLTIVPLVELGNEANVAA